MINELIYDVCAKLEKAKIEYMLSGSIAMGIYTVGRNSLDVDIVVNLKEEDVLGFIALFSKRYFIQPKTVEKEVKRRGMFNIIDETTGFKVDFIVKKSSDFRDKEFSRRKKVKLFEKEIFIVAVEDLVLSKLIWIQVLQSEMQMRDISMLLRNIDIDKKYLTQWIKQLNLNTFGLL